MSRRDLQNFFDNEKERRTTDLFLKKNTIYKIQEEKHNKKAKLFWKKRHIYQHYTKTI